MRSTPSRAASGMVLRIKARPRSVAIKSGLRRTRSTHTPASKPITSTDTPSNAPRIPIWVGVAARTSTAVSGSAMPVIPLPKFETVRPSHSLTKSGLFHIFNCGLNIVLHLAFLFSFQPLPFLALLQLPLPLLFLAFRLFRVGVDEIHG